ncbi:MAG: methyltransferase domain-containing protein [Saprospiraceae bacterium]|nr:methyltransferase domain-containing protein [Saprospiraceae bacterium]
MIDSGKILEKFLQNQRFKHAKPHIIGDVLDFGGNDGELKPLVTGSYTLVNYDHTPMKNKTFDTIVCMAVIEHIDVAEVYRIFSEFKKCLNSNGSIVISTPTKLSIPILESLSFLHILDKENIKEHKHYWNKSDLLKLAHDSDLVIEKYYTFQFGANQLAVFNHKDEYKTGITTTG